MSSPTISVIIPAYNASGFIRDALDSVDAQTVKNLEVIVIDDGSTDNTVDIITSEYPKVKVLRAPNGGPARARNIGIRASHGDFIAFLDADDVWLPHKLERQFVAMTRKPEVAMTFTEAVVLDSGRVLFATLNKKRRLMTGDLVRNIFSKSYLGTSTVMVRRSVLDEVGYFEEGLLCAEDDNLWMRIAMRAPVILIDEPLAHARNRSNSLSSTSEKLFSGVKAHLALLETKYPELKERLGVLLPKKHSTLHFRRGLELIAADEPILARAEFSIALRHWPANAQALAYWLATFLPIYIFPLLRIFNRFFRRLIPRSL